jgi:N-glycosylase/DNA lyase
MLNTLCAACGTSLGTVDGCEFHSFPSLERLCELKEDELRGMGFGYRQVASAAATCVRCVTSRWQGEVRRRERARGARGWG